MRFIRSDAWLDVFGEQFRLPSEAVYEYVVATVDVARQTLLVSINEAPLDEHEYWLR